ncbi:MAG: pyrroloquinoline quinone biosynthesis peptide chaperone PqqD [Candidatus Thiodiazotropha sp.]|nr:pyrroloquinoline quinone biosynthesis peptide chaperone PqqD [Candidatus Thiodiazotropha taylori]MBT3058430.1 pyrroloquinoline quinone biosynthesis peptide chaperone PqqD [Candidatus Thiodiazotropha sp. (ex Lucina pensylvanica)]MBV2094355.1 pyrroloquinoline quinone biosynthesis peptide chaperone PqqD [Candidatus Thiodiazotropha sp. (ex Codakia orbicularis)]PUB74744.1 MAG: pyrroloquinoline quinone biosynthesis peptide chaperone PqqD [gamma proteobacterium symbiont of Ctena orbiculata]MBT30614
MSSRFNADDVPQISPTFRLQWEEAQGCHVILYPEGMVKLNPAAGEILKRCDGEASVARIIDQLKAAFPGAELEADVYQFLDTAYENQWIRHRRA